MSKSLLDELQAELDTRAQDRQAAYQRLPAAVLDGTAPSTKQIESILTAAGKTLADLRKDVADLQQRRADVAIVEGAAEIDAEQAEIDAALNAEASRWAAMEREHNGIINPLLDRRQALQAMRSAVRAAQDRLWASASPAVRQELREIEARQKQLHDALDEAHKRLRGLETERGNFEKELENLPSLRPTADAAAQCEATAQYRERSAAAIEQTTQRIAVLQAELDGTVQRSRQLYETATTVA